MGDTYTRAVRAVIVAGAMWFLVRPALADPPQHGPLTCDPVCVVRYCAARCEGPHRERLQGRVECRRECVRYVTEHGCWPCAEGSADE